MDITNFILGLDSQKLMKMRAKFREAGKLMVVL